MFLMLVMSVFLDFTNFTYTIYMYLRPMEKSTAFHLCSSHFSDELREANQDLKIRAK